MPFSKNYVTVKIFRYGELPELASDLEYFDDSIGVIVVPKGFKTDFASIPRIFWNIIAPIDKWTLPSVLHDYLYDCGYKYSINRKRADKIFYNAMIESGVSKITASIMWLCVRVFARKHYNKGVENVNQR